MFRLNRCKFTTGTTVLQLNSKAATANTVYDLRKITTQELVFKDTDILYYDKATSNATGAFDADFADATVGENYYLDERKVLTANNGAYILKTEFVTSDDFNPHPKRWGFLFLTPYRVGIIVSQLSIIFCNSHPIQGGDFCSKTFL